MKKILLSFLALGGLLFASSCQMDEPDAGTLTGEVDFSITAGIPSGITTYSPTDGNAFSHLGGINNVSGDYVLRFILEVYDGDAVAYEDTQYLEDFSNPNVTFNPRLLAKKYDFVFWADFVAKPSEGSTPTDLYYSTANLSSIEYTQTVKDDPTVLTTDLADAYTTNKVIDLSESSQNVIVSLTRPFGKIRLLATDAPQNQVADDLKVPVSATIAFTDATVPTTFNARTGETSEPTLSVTEYNFTAVKELSPVVTGHSDLAQEGKFAYLLGQTYFFESPSSTAYKMTVTVKNGNEQIGYRELTNIPVSANKLTTVIGNFYSNEGNLEVVVEDKFGEEDAWNEEGAKYVGTAEEVLAAINTGMPNIILKSDVNLTNSITLTDDAKTELDLNGKTLSFGSNAYVNVSGSEITFKNGTINATSSSPANKNIMAVGGNGTITLDRITFSTDASAIGTEQNEGGHIVIRDSKIQAKAYAFSTNATSPVSQNVEIEITGSTLIGASTIFVNIPCNITIDDCNISGTMHGTVIRGGTAKISNSSITLTYNDDDFESMATHFKGETWGNGNRVNIAALTIGNKSTSYQYPTNVTLANTDLILAGDHGSAFPALYAYANQGEGLGVTLTYDEFCTFNGNLVYGSENIVVNGNKVTPNEQ